MHHSHTDTRTHIYWQIQAHSSCECKTGFTKTFVPMPFQQSYSSSLFPSTPTRPLSTPRPHLAHLFCGVLHKKHMAVTNEGLLLRRIPDSLVCFRLFAWPLPSFNGELLGGAARDLALAATNGPYSLDNSPHSQSWWRRAEACGSITNGFKHGASCRALAL